MPDDVMPDPPPTPTTRSRRGHVPAALRVKAEGSYRSVDAAWGVNFGPSSDVDQVIPGSGGLTLRALKEAGEIRADCFADTVSDEG